MQVLHSDTPAKTAGAHLTDTLKACTDRPVLLLLSGGSALAVLDHIDCAALGPHLTITTLDERYTTDPQVNNFAQVQVRPFYQAARAAGVNEIATTVTVGETLEMAGERIRRALRQWRIDHPEGVMVATVGVGEDGHIAGIFPVDHGVDFSGAEWVVAYEVPPAVNMYTKRITVTPTFLETQLHTALVFITGPHKQPLLEALTTDGRTQHSLPLHSLAHVPSVTVVTDIPLAR